MWSRRSRRKRIDARFPERLAGRCHHRRGSIESNAPVRRFAAQQGAFFCNGAGPSPISPEGTWLYAISRHALLCPAGPSPAAPLPARLMACESAPAARGVLCEVDLIFWWSKAVVMWAKTKAVGNALPLSTCRRWGVGARERIVRMSTTCCLIRPLASYASRKYIERHGQPDHTPSPMARV